MPLKMMEENPYKYVIPIRNREGETKTVSTNLYFLGKMLIQMNRGFSPLIMICGKQRVGKSFVSQLIIKWVLEAFSKYDTYDPTKRCFYEPKDMIRRLGDMYEDVANVDEAGSIMGRRQWYDQIHSVLEKIIQTQGYKTMCYIFISPFGIDIDKVFVKHFDFIIRVDYRGKFKVFRTIKRYDELNNYKMIKLFMDDVTYNLRDVPADVWASYEKYSMDEKEKLRKKYAKDREEGSRAFDPIQALKKALKEAS